MPLPQDEWIVSLANELLEEFDRIFGFHPGFRAAHAKGVLLAGTFMPAKRAERLTRAPHVTRDQTRIVARFSNSTGIPALPDNTPDANPRGLAVRFHLAEHVHTDIVSHSTDGFPTRDGKEFLDFLKALAASGPTTPSPKPVEQFLASHPAALGFVQTPKPFPSSFATDTYFAVTAYEFTNASGQKRFGRYRIVPEAGNRYLTQEEVNGLTANYHFEEIEKRLASDPVRFKILVQIAEEHDQTDDATVHWPEDRELLEFGAVEMTHTVENNAAEQKQIIFDPIPRVDGIGPSADPLLELRAAIYLLSGRRRRQS